MDTQKLQALLKGQSKNIVIVTHKNPDGDAMGSSLGLYHILKNAGHNVHVITPNDYPSFLKWMPGEKDVWRYEWTKSRSHKTIMGADMIFCLDFNDISRIEALGAEVTASKAIKVLIDHHLTPVVDVDYTYSDDNMIATAEMIYHFAQKMDMLEFLDKDSATCIYTGILTDSGEFAFPKTSAVTHYVVSELMKKGVDNYAVYQHIYMSFAQSRLLLLGKSLSNMHIFSEQAAVCMTLTQEELDAAGFKKGDTEGFVNYGLTIKNINVSCIFIENKSEGIIKVSLRSKGNFSVNEMSRQFFNGAGHINAAGGQLPTTDMQYAVSRFKEAVEYYKDAILASNEQK
ncbi:MAG: DHH family phosphoesterase [Flavobacteriales bacterium]|nr:DHH family phosphoesterase [Flavobacteriales bacterium]